jgi:hypothetical protein
MAATAAPASQAYRVRPLDESTWPAFAALDMIAALGGGVVEGYPETAGPVPAGFLFNGALSSYEKLGFTRDRQIGKHRWVVTKRVRPQA